MEGHHTSNTTLRSPYGVERAGTRSVRGGQQGPHDSLIEISPDDLHIQLFGDFRVALGTRVILESEWPLRRARNLMKILALAAGHRLHREQLTELLWPAQAQEAAANNLHKALHTARHLLEPHLASKAPSRYLQLQGDLVVLQAPGMLWTDVEEFQRLAEAARASRQPDDYDVALSLYTGDLLPQDTYEDWAVFYRERLQNLRVDVLLGLAESLEEREHFSEAIKVLRQVLDIDPAHEEAHGRLMLLLARSGQRQLALRQYLQLQNALEEELGAEPDPAIQQLSQDIRENRIQELSLGSTRTAPAEAVPVVPPPLVIGREQEVAELDELLAALRGGTGNIAFICGEAGSGKTYLIEKLIEYATRLHIVTIVGSVTNRGSGLAYEYLASALRDYATRSPSQSKSVLDAEKLAQKLMQQSGSPVLGQQSTSVRPMPPHPVVIDFFRQLSETHPVLVMLDDLHLADEASLRVIASLADLASKSAILIIGLVEPSATEARGHVLDLFERRLEWSVPVLDLHPLAYSETVALVTQVLSAPADRNTVSLVHSLSEGLPHFVRETALALAGRGGVQLVDGRWVMQPDAASKVQKHTLRQPSQARESKVQQLVRNHHLQAESTA